ncbi:enoyl-CoA hydratase/isomerase family protein (plasmid) [Rhodococcus ruber]|uniref:enoyl-CoA hydratase/isomerase family protein n=1 Tax=Rhodococcus ruber TaxID=1830 RepID=UPI0026595C38|nr:enoyl-CoA hydratase/isomerase family protein [Rhodococcus ruber]WKK14853.1 enoyl-CoA hydratase/isomerase family protein [Rhodococcus ruber]
MTGDADGEGAIASVEYSLRSGAAWLVLNRPRAANGLDPMMIAEFSAALQRAGDDDAVKNVVITGAGNAFCAGVDLSYASELGKSADRAFEEFLQPFAALVANLEAFNKPLIAAVNGACVGGGLEILLACDVVISAEQAVIGDGHVVYGLLPVTGLVRKLVRAIGSIRASSLLLTGSLYPAAELMSAGLVNRVVAAEHLETEVQELANLIGRRSTTTLSHLKSMLRGELDMTDHSAALFELGLAREHFDSGIPQQGITAFVKGREPDFEATQ